MIDEIKVKKIGEEKLDNQREEERLREIEEISQRRESLFEEEPEHEEVLEPFNTTGSLISLGAKDIKSEKNVLDKDKLAKIGLMTFSVILILLFVFKILKWSKKTERFS